MHCTRHAQHFAIRSCGLADIPTPARYSGSTPKLVGVYGAEAHIRHARSRPATQPDAKMWGGAALQAIDKRRRLGSPYGFIFLTYLPTYLSPSPSSFHPTLSLRFSLTTIRKPLVLAYRFRAPVLSC